MDDVKNDDNASSGANEKKDETAKRGTNENVKRKKGRGKRGGESRPKVVVGIRFRRAGRIYYFSGTGFENVAVGDHVVVDTARGHEMGHVVMAPGQMVKAETGKLKPILRLATEKDHVLRDKLKLDEADVLRRSRQLIANHKLPMKAVVAEHNFDGSRLTIYFVSEKNRVDFRELVREMAKTFRKRVLLRQIGPRDEAKILGGIDRCGRELCCTSWMPEFKPISIRMAKNQRLPLNPSEISGVCGKLLCCLSFEDEQYMTFGKGLPKVGAKMTSAVGRGRVVDVNVLTQKITIAWETGSRVEVDAAEFKDLRERKQRAFGDGEAPAPA